MNDQIIIAATLVAGLGLVALITLRGWQGWLALKERELERVTVSLRNSPLEIEDRNIDGSGMARIEIADLKERIRRLEAIANGVDL